MSGTVFNQTGYTLDSLVQKIEMGEIGLPDLQRPFVWPNTKVRKPVRLALSRVPRRLSAVLGQRRT